MEALILAAGYGTRLYPLTRDRPKPLLPVGGRPLLDHLAENLDRAAGLRRIVVVVNGRFEPELRRWADRIRGRLSTPVELLSDGTERPEERLGAVGDLAFAVERLGPRDDLLVAAGDNIFEFEIGEMIRAFGAGGSGRRRGTTSGRPRPCGGPDVASNDGTSEHGREVAQTMGDGTDGSATDGGAADEGTGPSPDVSARIDWDGDLRFRARAGEWVTRLDGDGESATSPVQLLLEAVGGCAAVDVAHILRKGREDPREIEVEVSGRRADDHPRRLTHLAAHVRVAGDVDPGAVRRAARLSFETYCSCYHSLRDDIELDVRVTVRDGDGPRGGG